MAGTLHTISVISFVLAILFLIIAIILYFVFKIPNVVGDLSGRNAKKTIERMRESNEKSGRKTLTVNKIKTTNNDTEVINSNSNTNRQQETVLLSSETTEPLINSNTTELLGESTVALDRPPSSIVINMIEEVMLIHTDEEIE